MQDPRHLSDLRALDRPPGALRRYLRLGHDSLAIEGLDAVLVAILERRWGEFFTAEAVGATLAVIRLQRSERPWLRLAGTREQYRIEALGEDEQQVVLSYNFAIGRDTDGSAWRVGIHFQDDEPMGRVLDNVLRYFAARVAVERGGFALHAAAVLRDGQAYMFAGPSGSGKSTVVGLSAPSASLGDDMGVVLPGRAGWAIAALPFDNSEQIAPGAPMGLFPLAGIWRLRQAPETRVVRPRRGLATASLMGCAAFPWALPDLADPLLSHVGQFVADDRYAELHFTKDSGFWSHLVG